MAADAHVSVAVVGVGADPAKVRAQLAGLGRFELVEGAADVSVLVCAAGAPDLESLAATHDELAGAGIVAAPKPSAELVRFALDRGLEDVLALPVTPEALLFAVERAARSTRRSEGHEPGRVVTVFSPKGGTGKSVVSTNLSAAIASHTSKRALLVDLDLQFGDAAIMLGLAPENTVRELIDTPATLDAEKLAVYTERHESGVDVLSAPMRPEEAELIGEDSIVPVLELARATHDVVVVDTAPFFYGPMLATLDHTDDLLLVCTPDIPTLKNVRLTLNTLSLLSFPETRIRVVLNKASSRVGMGEAEVEAALDRRVDVTLPLDPAVGLAVNQGSPAVLSEPGAPFSKALLELARAVAGGEWTAPKRRRPAGRILTFGRS